MAFTLSALLAGCAALTLAPRQAQVLDQFAACHHEGPGVVLAEVQMNGEFTLHGVFRFPLSSSSIRSKTMVPATPEIAARFQ